MELWLVGGCACAQACVSGGVLCLRYFICDDFIAREVTSVLLQGLTRNHFSNRWFLCFLEPLQEYCLIRRHICRNASFWSRCNFILIHLHFQQSFRLLLLQLILLQLNEVRETAYHQQIYLILYNIYSKIITLYAVNSICSPITISISNNIILFHPLHFILPTIYIFSGQLLKFLCSFLCFFTLFIIKMPIGLHLVLTKEILMNRFFKEYVFREICQQFLHTAFPLCLAFILQFPLSFLSEIEFIKEQRHRPIDGYGRQILFHRFNSLFQMSCILIEQRIEFFMFFISSKRMFLPILFLSFTFLKDLNCIPHDFLLHPITPSILGNLLQCRSFVRIKLQYVHNEVFEVRTNVLRQLIRSIRNGLLYLCKGVGWEGCPPMQQLIQQHPQCPHIYLIVIFLFEYHFRCHVLISAAEGLPLLLDVVGGPPQITQFHIHMTVQQNVLRLQVSVHYVHLVQVIDC